MGQSDPRIDCEQPVSVLKGDGEMNRICLLKAKLLRAGGCCLLALCLLLKAVPAGASGGISAKAYILIEASTGRVLAASREHERLPIASTTKILTALIALEEPGTEEVFTVDSAAIRVEGTSMGQIGRASCRERV